MDIIPFLLFVFFLFLMIFLAARFLMSGVQIVPEGNVAIVERQGRFLKVLNPGRHFLMPLIDHIRTEVPLTEFDEIVPAMEVVLSNAAVVKVDLYIQYRVAHYYPKMVSPEEARRMQAEAVIVWERGRVRQSDIYKAVYTVDDWLDRTKKEAVTITKGYMATIDLRKDIFGGQVSALKQISAIIKRQLNERTCQYGVEVTDLAVSNPVVDDHTREFLNSISRTQLQSRIKQMEAEAQARIQQIEAEAQAKVQETLKLSQEELLRWQRTQALKEMSQNNPAARIYVGSDEPARYGSYDEEEPEANYNQPAENSRTNRPNVPPPYNDRNQI
jgi:regulator of protease activity HflC (stomatin/prohibitin superfamily)